MITSYGTIQQSVTSFQLTVTGFDLIGSPQTGIKTLNNKHAEREQICHWVKKRCNTKQYDTYNNTYIMGSYLRTHTHTHTHDKDNESPR